MLQLKNRVYFGDLAETLGARPAEAAAIKSDLIVGAFSLPEGGTWKEYSSIAEGLWKDAVEHVEWSDGFGTVIVVLHSAKRKNDDLGVSLDDTASELVRALSSHASNTFGNDITAIAITIVGDFDPQLVTQRIHEATRNALHSGDRLVITYDELQQSSLRQIIAEQFL